jgi:hypothetical protein
MVLLWSAGAVPLSARAAEPTFDALWHDGKAELDGYRLTVQRYGQPRAGRAVLIYVTEPFSRTRHVKVEDPQRRPDDTLEAFKLNLVRQFQTGIYDYNTMLSVFARSADFQPQKVAFSSTEWCGQVYEQLDLDGGRMSSRIASYFEDESGTSELAAPPGGVLEDELLILLRGLRGPYMRPGERRHAPLLPSAFWRRLAHRPLAWTTAELERAARRETVGVPAGRFEVDRYSVSIADGRSVHIDVEAASPHRVVRWETRAPTTHPPLLGGTDAGELTGTARLPYWTLHDPGDERMLERLGLTPRQ